MTVSELKKVSCFNIPINYIDRMTGKPVSIPVNRKEYKEFIKRKVYMLFLNETGNGLTVSLY